MHEQGRGRSLDVDIDLGVAGEAIVVGQDGQIEAIGMGRGGIGLLLLSATSAKDYALMQGIFLVLVLAVLIANIIADIAYAILDPRTRQTEA